jgi:hypothetical protein
MYLVDTTLITKDELFWHGVEKFFSARLDTPLSDNWYGETILGVMATEYQDDMSLYLVMSTSQYVVLAKFIVQSKSVVFYNFDNSKIYPFEEREDRYYTPFFKRIRELMLKEYGINIYKCYHYDWNRADNYREEITTFFESEEYDEE